MHISEGVLAAPVLVAGGILAISGVAVGIRRLDPESIPKTALLTAAFFLASLVHVPIGPSSVHLILNGLLGVLLGWAAFPAIFTALVLQAVLFQFGGLTTLGVNTFTMAGPAVLFGLPARWLIRKKAASNRIVTLAAGGCGAFSILGSGLFAAVSLSFSGEAFSGVARLILLAHLPVAGIEAVITSLSVAALLRMRPEMILPAGRHLSLIAAGMAAGLVFSASDAVAHRVHVFAWDAGNAVKGEVYFSGGAAASGALIEAVCEVGHGAFTGKTGEKGEFAFPRPDCPSVLIAVDAGMGHRAETRVDLAGQEAASVSEKEETRPFPSDFRPGEGLGRSDVEAILDEKLEPIRRELARLSERENHVNLRDVIAGLGYIAGATGCALYVVVRRKRKT